MEKRTTHTTAIKFNTDECKLIDRFTREHVGERTITSILDEYSFVISFYTGLLSALRKVYSHTYVTFTPDEYNALSNIVSYAYNSPDISMTDKITIAEIGSALDTQYHEGGR